MRYRVLNMPAQSRRPFLRNRLGAEAAPQPEGLASVSLTSLISRRNMAVAPKKNSFGSYETKDALLASLIAQGWPFVDEATLMGTADATNAWWMSLRAGGPSIIQAVSNATGIPAADVLAISKVGRDPSSEDLSDAALIDRFYSQPMGPAVDPFNVKACIPFTPPAQKGEAQIDNSEIKKNNFYCSPPARDQRYDYNSFNQNFRFEYPGTPYAVLSWGSVGENQHFHQFPSLRANFYITDPYGPWGTLKQTTKNADVLDKVLKDYPFPPPFDERYIFFWAQAAVQGVREFVSIPVDIDTSAARAFVTFSVLGNYEAMVAGLTDYLEDKKKNMKRKAQIIGIAALVIGGILALVALPVAVVIAAKTITAAAGAITKVQSAELAKHLNDIAGAFQDEAPAFAEEVRFANAWQEAAVNNVQDAIGRGETSAALPSMSSGLQTGLLAGGALAALGTIAYLIFGK